MYTLRINKKGNSLRAVNIVILFIIMTLTICFIWVGQGTKYYGKNIEGNYSESIVNINDKINDMDAKSKRFNEKIEGITESPGTTLFFIPAVILQAIKLSFSYISTSWSIFTAFNSSLGIYSFIITTLSAAFLFYIGWLILDAYLRNKRS